MFLLLRHIAIAVAYFDFNLPITAHTTLPVFPFAPFPILLVPSQMFKSFFLTPGISFEPFDICLVLRMHTDSQLDLHLIVIINRVKVLKKDISN